MSPIKPKSRFEFHGGNLCLDFVNTVNNRSGEHPEELLTSYEDLVRWGVEAGVVGESAFKQLCRLAKDVPGHAQTTLSYSIRVREAIYAIFSSIAERRGIPDTAIAMLNSVLQKAAQNAQLSHSQRRFRWEWISAELHFDSLLWPVTRAAADLLVSDDVSLVRQCASQDCAWLFLDKTKNHRRRWCDMQSCGNRDKARRYYARKKR